MNTRITLFRYINRAHPSYAPYGVVITDDGNTHASMAGSASEVLDTIVEHTPIGAVEYRLHIVDSTHTDTGERAPASEPPQSTRPPFCPKCGHRQDICDAGGCGLPVPVAKPN